MTVEAAAKKTATKAKKTTKSPATHPPVAVMVTEAITALKERNGSSLPAIKKYIAGHFMVDVDRLAPFIRKFLKKGVEHGKLKQIKASYKVDKTKVEKPKKPAKKPAAKTSPKKAAAKPKKAVKPPKKDAKSKKAKTPKAEKPKKAKTPKKAAAKPKKPATKKTPKKAAKKPVKK